MALYNSTSEVKHLRPANVRSMATLTYISTRKLSTWLVAEASKYEDVRGRYQLRGTWYNRDTRANEPLYVITRVRDYVDMAKIIYKHSALTNMSTGALLSGPLGDTMVDAALLAEVKSNVDSRGQISAWYQNQPSAPGSSLRNDNSGHQHFNEQLGVLLQTLQHLHQDRP